MHCKSALSLARSGCSLAFVTSAYRVIVMRKTRRDPEGSSQSPPLQPESSPNTEALLSALKLASWMGLEMWVRDVEGTTYQVNAPVIIGRNFVQFATGMSLRPVSVPLSHIAEFELP